VIADFIRYDRKKILYFSASILGLLCIVPQFFTVPFLLLLACVNFYLVQGIDWERNAGRLPKILYWLVPLNFSPLLLLKFQQPWRLDVYPVGTTFFVMQLTSYIVGVGKSSGKSRGRLLDFLLYLFYLPKFFVGPIETFDGFRQKVEMIGSTIPLRSRAVGAVYLIGIGSFKSLVLGRGMEPIVSDIFNSKVEVGWITALALIYLSALQLYCHFSGFVDIARGSSSLLGIELQKNFDFPILSQNLQDFWRRWHITFADWLREHVYYPLANLTKNVYLSAFFTIFPVSLWHGLDWKFFLVGALHASTMIIYMYFEPLDKRICASLRGWAQKAYAVWQRVMAITIVSFGLFVLVAPSLSGIQKVLLGFLSNAEDLFATRATLSLVFFSIAVFGLERILYRRGGNEYAMKRKDLLASAFLMLYFSFLIFFFNAEKSRSQVEFLYFQF